MRNIGWKCEKFRCSTRRDLKKVFFVKKDLRAKKGDIGHRNFAFEQDCSTLNLS